MKTKSVFIVRELDGTAKVITEGVLTRDIKNAYNKHYGASARPKLIERMAAEAMQDINGQSITREQYESNLGDYVNTIEIYSTISLIRLSNMVTKLEAYEQTLNETAA